MAICEVVKLYPLSFKKTKQSFEFSKVCLLEINWNVNVYYLKLFKLSKTIQTTATRMICSQKL